jgi:hypothetical protein
MISRKCECTDPPTWGDLSLLISSTKVKLHGSPCFGCQKKYQWIALIGVVEAFYPDIEVEIEICPDPLPNIFSSLGLKCRPLQLSGIHLTLVECFNLTSFVDYIIIRGILKPAERSGWVCYLNSLAKMWGCRSLRMHGLRRDGLLVYQLYLLFAIST